MPKFDCQCTRCGEVMEYVRPISERHRTPICPECDGKMELVILKPPEGFVKGRFEAFKSTVDGSIIRNSRDMEEHNRRNGVVNLSDGYDEEAILSGKCCEKPKKDAADLANDVGEAVRDINAGYKPKQDVYDE